MIRNKTGDLLAAKCINLAEAIRAIEQKIPREKDSLQGRVEDLQDAMTDLVYLIPEEKIQKYFSNVYYFYSKEKRLLESSK